MPLNPFHFHGKSTTDPAVGSFPITPADGTDLEVNIRAITIYVAGIVTWVSSQDGLTKTTNPLPAGTYPMLASRIRATGTTATGLTGWV